jgi:hypothetical protein
MGKARNNEFDWHCIIPSGLLTRKGEVRDQFVSEVAALVEKAEYDLCQQIGADAIAEHPDGRTTAMLDGDEVAQIGPLRKERMDNGALKITLPVTLHGVALRNLVLAGGLES